VLVLGCATGAIMIADGQKSPPAGHDELQGVAPGPMPGDVSTPPGRGRQPGTAQSRAVGTTRGRPGIRKQPTADITTQLPSITMLGPGLSHRSPVTAPVSAVPGAVNAPDSYSVLHLLSRYFGAINSLDFAAYQRLFGASIRPSLSSARFAAGYATMRDTQATLLGVRFVNAQLLAADVAFVSHQQAKASPTGTTCNRWDVTFYLSREDGRLVIVSSPDENSLASTCLL
jgi:hypothetical protein